MNSALKGIAAVSLVLTSVLIAGCMTVRFEEKALVKAVAAPELDLAAAKLAFPVYEFSAHRSNFALAAEPQSSLYWVSATRADAKATVFYVGGNIFTIANGHKHPLSQYAKLPVNIVMIDHIGYGASTGKASLDGMQQGANQVFIDAQAWFATEPSTKSLAIFVHGYSIGSFSAGYIAQNHTLTGLILEGSATTAEEWAELSRTRSIFSRVMVSKIDMDDTFRSRGNLKVAQSLDEPTLFFVGEKDSSTPKVLTEKLYAAAPSTIKKKLVIVPGADHGDASYDPLFVSAFNEMFIQ